MQILIDADKLIMLATEDGKMVVPLESLTDAIVHFPRCSDCKHRDVLFGVCMENSRPVEPTDFCSWAERKEE